MKNNSRNLLKLLLAYAAKEFDEASTDRASSAFFEVDKRVINGNIGSIDDFGYLVAVLSIRNNDTISYQCGGAILSSEWIVTAAHCYNSSWSYLIRAGQNEMIFSRRSTDNEVIDIVIHDEYKAYPVYENDVALMKVKRKFKWDKQHRFIKMYKEPKKPVELRTGIVASYGSTNEDYFNLTVDGHIHVASLSIRSQRYCEKIFRSRSHKFKYYFGPKTLCAGGLENDVSVNLRTGDSGSPLVVDDRLVGIGSWISLLSPYHPSVFTRISVYRNWIKNKISGPNLYLNCYNVE